MAAEHLQLVEPTESLRDAYVAFVREFNAEGNDYISARWQDIERSFPAFVQRLLEHARGIGLPAGWVPASSYWLVHEGRVLGECGLRHALTDFLRDFGGHIGYGVRPCERRKGYATFMLRAMMARAREMGMERVLVTCAATNVASAGVIEKCGGILESETYSPNARRVTRRYWIDLTHL